MNKLTKLVGFATLATVVVLSAASCAPKSLPHVHEWGEWQRNETDHWRVCQSDGCGKEQRGFHDDFVCDECMEFRVAAFGDLNGSDPAHNDFAKEANVWFVDAGREHGFIYDFTENWADLNDEFLANYDLVMFLNNKPWGADQRVAFQKYMENGGAWIGYHVCAFATNAKDDWSWYHNEFLCSGNFRTNTWNPTRETIKVDTHDHFATTNLPDKFESAYNEWYGWEVDLRKHPDITVLLSLDESTFPVGDKVGEQWFSGDFPVAWANKKYNMIYMNMGHNLQDYNTYEKESKTFEKEIQNQFVLDAMFGLAKK